MRRAGLFLLLLLPLASFAQRGLMERKRPEIIPTDGKMRRGGFYVAPGITYPLAFDHEVHYGPIDATGDIYFEPAGAVGLYLEAGWFHASRDPWIIDYSDFGLAFKQLKGTERSRGTMTAWGDTTAIWSDGAAQFNDRYLTAHVNANKFIQTHDHQFVQFSLGVNADHRIGRSTEVSGIPFTYDQDLPPDLIAQLHFKLGYGFKVSRRLLIIPAFETPVFSVVPGDQGFGQSQWFSSRYRPLIFSVRFLFLRYPRGFDCPPPIRHNEFEKHKEYKPDSYHP